MVKDILARSVGATCGISEREVTVATQNMKKTISKLKNAGFHVIGTSYASGPTKKIWFIRPGSL